MDTSTKLPTDRLITLKNHCRICGIRASFNIEGESTGLYCTSHKKAGMVNVKDKTLRL